MSFLVLRLLTPLLFTCGAGSLDPQRIFAKDLGPFHGWGIPQGLTQDLGSLHPFGTGSSTFSGSSSILAPDGVNSSTDSLLRGSATKQAVNATGYADARQEKLVTSVTSLTRFGEQNQTSAALDAITMKAQPNRLATQVALLLIAAALATAFGCFVRDHLQARSMEAALLNPCDKAAPGKHHAIGYFLQGKHLFAKQRPGRNGNAEILEAIRTAPLRNGTAPSKQSNFLEAIRFPRVPL